MRMRMTRGSEPGTGSSRAHSSGTLLRPMLRAATAGNSASRSSVSVKMQLTRSGTSSALRSSSSRINSPVAARIGSDSLTSTVVAPRSAMSRIGRGIQSAPRAAGPARAAQPFDLRRGEAAMLARREPLEPERPEGDALELGDRVPDRVAHAPHLPLAPLVDRDLEQVGGEPLHPRRRGHAVVELDPAAQPLERGPAHGRAADLRAVDARDLEGGMG